MSNFPIDQIPKTAEELLALSRDDQKELREHFRQSLVKAIKLELPHISADSVKKAVYTEMNNFDSIFRYDIDYAKWVLKTLPQIEISRSMVTVAANTAGVLQSSSIFSLDHPADETDQLVEIGIKILYRFDELVALRQELANQNES